MASLKLFFKTFDTRVRFYRSLGSCRRVLELGVGSGENCIDFYRIHPQAEIHGVDIRCSPLPEYIRLTQVDIEKENLPFPEEYFDCVIITHVLEHLRDFYFLGAQIHRVLKAGGKVYVESPNWLSIFVPSFRAGRELGGVFNFFDDESHVRPLTRNSISCFIVQRCSLRLVKCGKARNLPRLPIDLLLFIPALILGRRKYAIGAFWNIYGYSVYAIGEK